MRTSAKEVIRRSLSRVATKSGLTWTRRRLFPKLGALILYCHRVRADDDGFLEAVRPDWFADQLAYLGRHYEIIALEDLLSLFEARQEIPRNAAVITMDDGFRDNFEFAFPLLKRACIPATVFLTTGAVSTGLLPWSQRLGVLFQTTPLEEVPAEVPEAKGLWLDSPEARRAAYSLVKPCFRSLGRIEREERLATLEVTLRVEAPRDRMLTWDQVREMKANGVSFGAHTYSHPLLALISRQEAVWEMERSREDLREQLGLRNPPFAFPGGSYNVELLSEVQRLGFRSAFTVERRDRVNRLSNADPYSLRRVGFPNAPAYVLEAELDGPFEIVRNLYWRKP